MSEKQKIKNPQFTLTSVRAKVILVSKEYQGLQLTWVKIDKIIIRPFLDCNFLSEIKTSLKIIIPRKIETRMS